MPLNWALTGCAITSRPGTVASAIISAVMNAFMRRSILIAPCRGAPLAKAIATIFTLRSVLASRLTRLLAAGDGALRQLPSHDRARRWALRLRRRTGRRPFRLRRWAGRWWRRRGRARRRRCRHLRRPRLLLLLLLLLQL